MKPIRWVSRKDGSMVARTRGMRLVVEQDRDWDYKPLHTWSFIVCNTTEGTVYWGGGRLTKDGAMELAALTSTGYRASPPTSGEGR